MAFLLLDFSIVFFLLRKSSLFWWGTLTRWCSWRIIIKQQCWLPEDNMKNVNSFITQSSYNVWIWTRQSKNHAILLHITARQRVKRKVSKVSHCYKRVFVNRHGAPQLEAWYTAVQWWLWIKEAQWGERRRVKTWQSNLPAIVFWEVRCAQCRSRGRENE